MLMSDSLSARISLNRVLKKKGGGGGVLNEVSFGAK